MDQENIIIKTILQLKQYYYYYNTIIKQYNYYNNIIIKTILLGNLLSK